MKTSGIEAYELPTALENVLHGIAEAGKLGNFMLPEFLLIGIISPYIKTSFFRGTYVEAGNAAVAQAQIIEVGAAIGYEAKATPEILLSLAAGTATPSTLAPVRAPAEIVSLVSGSAADVNLPAFWTTSVQNLDELMQVRKERFGSKPDACFNIFVTHLYSVLGYDYPHDVRRIAKFNKKKIRLGSALKFNELTLTNRVSFGMGVAFGTLQPGMYERSLRFQGSPSGRILATGSGSPHASGDVVENNLELCRAWADICRRDLAHLLP